MGRKECIDAIVFHCTIPAWVPIWRRRQIEEKKREELKTLSARQLRDLAKQ